MGDNGDQELDVPLLMTRIREAAEKRKSGSLIDASGTLYRLLKRNDDLGNGEMPRLPTGAQLPIPVLTLQPAFQARKSYKVTDLLVFHDQTFVRNAYKAILKREPDEAGFAEYLGQIRSGRLNKIDVLASLRFSPEGKSKEVPIKGLTTTALLRKVYRVPVLGYLIELMVGVMRLPVLIANQRILEAHTAAQHDRLAQHMNESLAEMSDTYQKVSDFHHQQIKAVIREQHEVSADQNRLKSDIANHILASQNQFKEAALAQELLADEWQRLRELIETKVTRRVQQTRMELVLQERRLSLLLEEARKRLPEPFQQHQLEILSEEKDHLLDSLYASLEDEVRGSREDIKQLLRFYLPILEKTGIKSNILDIGCGRGEWLEVLKGEGLSARGIDINRITLEQCSQLGLEAHEAEALSYLEAQPERSLNCVTAFHFVEHLSLSTLIRFLDELERTLKPGGLVIFETPNPENLLVGSCNFYLDPTHKNPIPSGTMRFLLEARGFCRVEVFKLHPPTPPLFRGNDELAKQLNDTFFGPMDYAIVGRTV